MSEGSKTNGRAATSRRRGAAGQGARGNGAGPNGDVGQEARERLQQTLGGSLDPGEVARSLGGLAERALRAAAGAVQARVPRADLDERDPDYIRERLPTWWLAASL